MEQWVAGKKYLPLDPFFLSHVEYQPNAWLDGQSILLKNEKINNIYLKIDGYLFFPNPVHRRCVVIGNFHCIAVESSIRIGEKEKRVAANLVRINMFV